MRERARAVRTRTLEYERRAGLGLDPHLAYVTPWRLQQVITSNLPFATSLIMFSENHITVQVFFTFAH